jgi:uncharacterized protein YndB with AHSA1/START domain
MSHRIPAAQKPKMTLERTYRASLEEAWRLFTTKEGLESWWGPEGFRIEVRKLELHRGGGLEYAMVATAPEQIEFMKKAGMPVSTETRATYTEVVPQRRLAYDNLVDFVNGVAPYSAATLVEFHPDPRGVRLVVTLDAMHDARWTELTRMGFESQLGKLDRALRTA